MRGLVAAVFGALAMQAVGVVADAPTFNGCVVSNRSQLVRIIFVEPVD